MWTLILIIAAIVLIDVAIVALVHVNQGSYDD